MHSVATKNEFLKILHFNQFYDHFVFVKDNVSLNLLKNFLLIISLIYRDLQKLQPEKSKTYLIIKTAYDKALIENQKAEKLILLNANDILKDKINLEISENNLEIENLVSKY